MTDDYKYPVDVEPESSAPPVATSPESHHYPQRQCHPPDCFMAWLVHTEELWGQEMW